MLKQALFLRLAQILIEQCLQFSVFEGFWPSFMRMDVNIEITVFEATEPITACFHLEQHLRKLFGALTISALQPPFFSNERRKSTLPANDDYLAQNQTFSHNQK